MERVYCRECKREFRESLWKGYPSDLWTGDHQGPVEFTGCLLECPPKLNVSKPLPGDPSRQDAGGFAPEYGSYVDRKRRCQHCGASYVFSASEQKYWYEKLGFYTRSKPTGCPECRQKLRKRKVTNRLIAERLKTNDIKDWRALRELARLYLQHGSRSKAIESLRRAKNLCGSDEGSKESICREIREFQASTTPILPNNQFSRLSWIRSDTEPEDLKSSVASAKAMLSPEGNEILAEIVRRWTKARYGESR